jgi:mRNA interferase YafQ
MKYEIEYSGEFKKAGIWECHIKPNWLLLWKQDNTKFTLLFLNTGTHSDLF